MSEKQVETFRGMISPFLDDWKSIDLRVVAQRRGDAQCLFHAIRAVLDHREPSYPTRGDLPQTPHLLVAHERWEVERLGEILDSIPKGELSLAEDTVVIRQFDGQNWKPVSSPYVSFWERNRCRSEFGIDLASFVLQIWQSLPTDYEFLRVVDAGLRSGSPPWDGLSDLRSNFLGFIVDKSPRTDAGTLEIIAPLGVRLSERSSIEERKLRAVVETNPGVSESEIVLSAIGRLPEGSTFRRLCNPTQAGRELGTQIELPLIPSNVKLIASYRGVDVDRREFFTAANPRLPAMELLGFNSDELRSSLEEARGQELEKCYAILLQILGFSPILSETGRDAPDMIAFPKQDDWVLVVECTEAEPDLSNKLTKLATRTKLVRQAMGGLEAQPVLMTRMRRGVLNVTDLEKAQKEGIAVVTLDEVPGLLQLAREGAESRKVRDYLSAHIPSRVLV